MDRVHQAILDTDKEYGCENGTFDVLHFGLVLGRMAGITDGIDFRLARLILLDRSDCAPVTGTHFRALSVQEQLDNAVEHANRILGK